MIHRLRLPDITRDRLMNIVLLQIDLLYFAASSEVGQDTCAQYLNYHPLDERFKGHGQAIAGWFWAPRTTIRHTHLEKFASLEKEEQQYKQAWCLRLRSEVCSFADIHGDSTKTSIDIDDFFKSGQSLKSEESGSTLTWKEPAASFFLHFYDTFLGQDNVFPPELFPAIVQKGFGRQNVLAEFLIENEGLEICPICDASLFYERGRKRARESDEVQKIHATLDHFLPKSRYPHFACHPYNLIPVCHTCNSTFKGEIDPLVDEYAQRLPLHRSALPYGDIDLSSSTYLEVGVEQPDRLIALGKLLPRSNDPELRPALALLERVYGLPKRWDEASSKISEALFRRIRQFLGNSSTMVTALPMGFDVPREVNNLLEQLLFYLSDESEDFRKDPFAFAMTWVLVAIINEHVLPTLDKQDKNPNYALLEEFISWFGQDLEANARRVTKARELLQVPLPKP